MVWISSVIPLLRKIREWFWLTARHRRCHTDFPPLGAGPLPIWMFITVLHMCLINLLKTPSGWTQLYIAFPVFLFPPLSHWNFCPNLCHFVYKTILPKSSILCLSLWFASLCHPSVTHLLQSLCSEQKAKGNCLGRNYLPTSVHIAFCSDKVNLLLPNAKVTC